MTGRLNPGAIKQHLLNVNLIPKELLIFDNISSTQDYIFDNLHRLKKGTVVLAESQEKGKGRLGRVWHSPSGVGIYMSILMPEISIPELHSQISLFTSLVIAKFLSKRYNLPFKVRWPNDVMVDDCKIAGVLAEQKEGALVVGIGINVNNNFSQLVEGATSLYILRGQLEDRNVIIAGFLNEYQKRLQEWEREGFSYIRSLWLNHSALKGKSVRAQVDSRFIEGWVEDLDTDCSLVIRNSHGYLIKIHVSSLVMIR